MMFGQKIQIAAILLILSAAGYLFLHNRGQAFDNSVNSWVLFRPHPKDKSKPMSASNPEDPKLREQVNGFSCADGKLEIIEYPNDPTRHATLKFDPEVRGGKRDYKYYQNPLWAVDAISDPFRHALALATYHSVYGTSLGLLGQADMDADQTAKEANARNAMNSSIQLITSGVQLGTFRPESMDQVMKALATYKAKSGDPLKDAKKAELARKVLEAAAAHMKKIQEEKSKPIEKYMDLIAAMFGPAQQTKLATAGRQWEEAQMPKPRVVKAPPRVTKPTVAGTRLGG